MAYQTLLHRFGRETAERYLVWREHQDPKKPVIILLGGTTGVGKTSIALEVASRLGIRRVMSTDSIRQVMRITLSPELAPALHVSSFDAHRHVPERAVIDGFMAQAQIVGVGVRAMIDRALEESSSLILDGVSIVPGLLDLDAYRDRANVVFLLVARLDEEGFQSHFTARGSRQRHRGLRRYLDNLDAILEVQDHLLELADLHDIPIVDNLSVDNSVVLVIRHVVETLRKHDAASDDPELPYGKI
jgi:2-phosphoglycerate kinase